jgi:oligopeptide transport system substrate-binding protein
MLRLLVPVVLLLGLASAFLVTDRPEKRADFVFVNRGDISTLDLQRISWMQDMRVARLMYEGLTRNDVFTWDQRVVPAGAERWDVSEDGRTYRFHLRADARWSNGEPVRASDYVYAWRRALLPETASDYAGQFQLIRGGKAFFDWRSSALAEFAAGNAGRSADELWDQTRRAFDDLVWIRAPDDRTLVVELEHPAPFFTELCAMPPFYPVYPPLVSRYERPDPATGRIESRRDWTKPPLVVCNGPFLLTRWRFKRDMRFEKNPMWWGRDTLAIDTISIPSIEDVNAQVLAFQTGGVDWVADVGTPYRTEMLAARARFLEEHRAELETLQGQAPDQFEIDRRLPRDPRACIEPIAAFGVYWYNFNCLPTLRDGRRNPFADPRVRRAFTMAIDKQTLVDQVQRIGNPVATTTIPPGSISGYHSPRGLPFDPAAARALLAEAGYPDPRAFPVTVDILINTEGDHDQIAEFVARNWEAYLGVRTSITRKEIKVFRADLKDANYIVSRAGWYGDYGDPTTFLDVHRTGDGNNDRKYSSPEFDRLLAAAAEETDAARRMSILEDAERIIVERDLPVAPLFQYVTLYLFDPHKIGGITPHPRTEQQLWWVDVLGDGRGSDVARTMPPWPGTAEQRSSGAANGG